MHNEKESVAKHANRIGCKFDFANAKTISTDHDFLRRLFLKAWYS